MGCRRQTGCRRPGQIALAENNFNGRTISIVSFSSDETARAGFGPFTPGFRSVPFGHVTALADAIDKHTVAVLLEPIRGEAGVVVPPDHYLPAVRKICTANNVLMIVDKIQSGLARTGRTFACDHWNVVPDIYLLGKALGGGVVPLSAVVADRDILAVLHPGEHGCTFSGSPFAAAIGHTVVSMLARGEFQDRATRLGARLLLAAAGIDRPRRSCGPWTRTVGRCRHRPRPGQRQAAQPATADRGVLVKDTHCSTLRFAPPLVITMSETDWAIDRFAEVLTEMAGW